MSINRELLKNTKFSMEHLLEVSETDNGKSKEDTKLKVLNCNIHGLTEHYCEERKNRPSITYRCRKCERINGYLYKERAVNYLGGKCIKCGYNKYIGSLAFHHRNPNEKEYEIANNLNRKWTELVKELNKCDLLCINCHYDLHTNIDFIKDEKNNSYNWQTRDLIYKLHGNECNFCGFDNSNALSYHHIDPSTKNFNVGRAIILNYKLQRIVNESKKCVLLCGNCHQEYHSQRFHQNIELKSTFNKSMWDDYKKEQLHKKENRTCKYCGLSIDNKMFCNKKCQKLYYQSPTKEELLLLIKEHSCARIGNMYNVTGNAVKKWLIKYDIKDEYVINGKIPTRSAYEPSIEKEVLLQYINDGLSMVKIAKEVNSTPDKIGRMFKYYGIKSKFAKKGK